MGQNFITTKGIRIGELVLALYILGTSVLLGIFGDFRNVFPNVDLFLELVFWTAFFIAPLALGITVLLGTLVNDTSISSFVIGGVAGVTLFVVSFCTYWFINPPSNNGLVVAHLISYVFGVALSLIIGLKHTIRRIFSSEARSEPVTRE
ncbi:hypothetical protein [Natrinema gari]|uniref:hypothetical protein n=1 Tax=Natrinema gari TaxID=419186 RepID=UPI001267B1F2|nr:hypothetical protein [Natrinema gari]